MGLAGKESDPNAGDSKWKDLRQEALLRGRQAASREPGAVTTEWVSGRWEVAGGGGSRLCSGYRGLWILLQGGKPLECFEQGSDMLWHIL